VTFDARCSARIRRAEVRSAHMRARSSCREWPRSLASTERRRDRKGRLRTIVATTARKNGLAYGMVAAMALMRVAGAIVFGRMDLVIASAGHPTNSPLSPGESQDPYTRRSLV